MKSASGPNLLMKETYFELAAKLGINICRCCAYLLEVWYSYDNKVYLTQNHRKDITLLA